MAGRAGARRSASSLSHRTRRRRRGTPDRVFICYRRDDSSGHASHLYDGLVDELGRKNVFFDTEDIPPGQDFPDEIQRALEASDTMLVVIGRRWCDAVDDQGRQRLTDPADHLRQEIELARTANLRVIPVLVQDARMPAPAALPESIRWLAFRHAAELPDRSWHDDVAKLVERLRKPKPRDRFASPSELRHLALLPRLAANALTRPSTLAISALLVAAGVWPARHFWWVGIFAYVLLSIVSFFDASQADAVGSRIRSGRRRSEAESHVAART